MDRHVKILGWLWIVNGVFSLLMILVGLLIVRANIPGEQDAWIVTVGSVCFFLPGIIADFVAGYGLLNYQRWARILVIILAVFNLVFLCVFVLPAALAIYTLVIMFNQETAALFDSGGTTA